MDIVLVDSPKNARCTECGSQTKKLVKVKPELISKSLSLCLKCYRKNFKKDIKVKIC